MVGDVKSKTAKVVEDERGEKMRVRSQSSPDLKANYDVALYATSYSSV